MKSNGVMFDILNLEYLIDQIFSLKNQRSLTLGCKNIGIRKSDSDSIPLKIMDILDQQFLVRKKPFKGSYFFGYSMYNYIIYLP